MLEIMTPEEFARVMKKIFPENPNPRYPGEHGDYDPECAHGAADNLMCELLKKLGYGAGIEIYEDADKWYA